MPVNYVFLATQIYKFRTIKKAKKIIVRTLLALLLLIVVLVLLFSLPIVQTKVAKYFTESINEKYNTDILIKKVDLSYLGNIRLKGVRVNDHHNDSMIYINSLTTSLLNYKNIKNNKVDLSEVTIDGLKLLLRTHEGEDNDNLSIFVDKFDDKDTVRNANPFILKSSKLKLKDSFFYLFDDNEQEAPIVFYENINGTVEDFKIEGPDVNANIRNLSFTDNHDLQVKSLSSDFTYTKASMKLSNTVLVTEYSEVKANITFSYKREDLADFNNKVQIDAVFDDSKASLIDLNKFYSELGKNDVVNFTTHVTGTLNDFKLNNLDLVSNRSSLIQGNFHFKNIFEKEKEFSLSAQLHRLSSDYQNLRILLPNILGKTLPSTLDKFGRFTIVGQSYITDNLVDAQLDINSSLGRSITDLELTDINNIDNASYSGKVEFIDLDFGEIIQDSLVGNISLVADVKGSGFKLETLNTSVKGNVSSYHYKGYNYRDIDVNGVFKNQLFNGILISRDTNLKMDFKGLADLSEDVYKFDFIAEINHSDFNKLNLFKRDSIAILKGIIDLKVSGNSIDNMVGQVDFFNASYTNQNDSYYFKDFNVTSEFDDENVRTITINSTDIVEGRVKGIFKFNELGKLTGNSLGSIYANYNPVKVSEGQFLDFNFKIYNKIVDVFFPKVKLGPNSSIRGKIISDEEKFELTVRSPKIEAYNNIVDNIRLQIDNKNPLYNTLLSVEKIDTKQYNIADLNLINITLNDTLFFRTNFKGGKRLDEEFDLSFYHTINENNKSVVGLKPSKIRFKGNEWSVNPSDNNQNKIVFDKSLKTFAIDKINMISGDQSVDLAGIVNGTQNKDVTLNLKNVKLEGITPDIEDFKLKGLVNGNINYVQTNGESFPLANIIISDFYTNNINQGTLSLIARGDNSVERYNIEAKLEKENLNNLLVVGEVDLTTRRPTIIANYELTRFNLNLLNALGKDVIEDIRGEVSGIGTITGLLENPDINGYLHLAKAGFSIPYLNVDYNILGRPKVELNEQTFRFTPAIISDNVHGTRGTLRGTLSHEMFEKWYLDLAIRTDNLLVLNTEEKEDVEYYGTGFMEGSATIRGYTDELVIDVVGTTKSGTEFIIPLSDVSTVSDSKLINFITNTEEQENLSKTQEVIFDRLKGLTLNFDLTVTKDAIAEIVIDKNTGSVLRGSGDGNMLIEINTNGKFDIYGSYVVDNGVYEFRNIVNKDFNVKPGGLVVWNGNPYDAFLNITAVYKTKANPSVLLENVGDNRRKIDVDLVAKITGQLLDSDIEYDVQLPNQNSVVNSELQFKMSDEYVKMTQFFSLLVTGSFTNLDEGIFSNNSGNAFLNRTASEKISNVLADLFKTKGDKFQLGVTVDLANKEDVRSYQLDDQLGVSFSSTIGERVSVNGRVGVPVGGNTQSAIFGEVEVALPLNEEGTLTARAYTKQNDVEYDITDAEGYTHGVGISWRVDFDNSKELFKKLFSKKEKDSIAKKIKKDTLKTRTNLINFQTKQKDSVNQKK